MTSRQRWISILTLTIAIDLFMRFGITFDFTKVMNIEAVLFPAVTMVLALLAWRESDTRAWPIKSRVGLVFFFALGGLRCVLWAVGYSLVVANFATLAVFVCGILVWLIWQRRKRRNRQSLGSADGAG